MVHDQRSVLGAAQQRQGQPSAVILDARTLQSPCESGPRAGYDGHKRKKGSVLLPRRWGVERSFGGLNRFRRLTRDYERLPETLAGLLFVVFAMLMLANMLPAASS